MNVANVSLINAIILIAFGLWGYFGSADPSPTALIPVGFGALILLMNPGVRKHNKFIAHLAVGATLLILLGLIMPLRGAIGRSDNLAIIRVVTMMIVTSLAMVFFVKSFIDARRARSDVKS